MKINPSPEKSIQNFKKTGKPFAYNSKNKHSLKNEKIIGPLFTKI